MNTKNTTFIGSRWFYAICFIGLFIVETLIALFVRYYLCLYESVGSDTNILLCAYIYHSTFARTTIVDLGLLVALKHCSTFNLLLYWDYKIVHWQK